MTAMERGPGEALVVRPAGRLDSSSSPAFEKDLIGRIEAGSTDIIVDFAEVDYISSAGLRVLLMAAKRVKAANGQIALCCLKEHCREVFEISGFLSIFRLFASIEAAGAA